MTLRPDQLKREIDALILRFPELQDDEMLMRDVLASETDFEAVMRKMVTEDSYLETVMVSQDVQIKRLADRKKRFQRRQDGGRELMYILMELTGQKKLELPEATVSIRNVAPGVTITDEAIIPEDFLVTTTRPDKTAIKAALNAGEDVHGATLGNAKTTISVRYT